jgi:hypothetical protein
MQKKLIALAIGAVLATPVMALDFGQKIEQQAKAQSLSLFGTLGTLAASSTASISAAAANADARALLTVAPGLNVSVVSANANLGANIDQMAFWPNDTAPSHLIVCNEQGAGQIALQKVELATGVVTNIVDSGLVSCDPVRRTPWGTILFGEENGTNGRMFELKDPLNTHGVVITGSGAATTIGGDASSVNVVFRGSLGQLSFEGLAVMPNGVVYFMDENRPGSGGIGKPGGGIFKFIPSTVWGGGELQDLANSPLASGTIYGMRVGRNPNDVGQGNEFGRGNWVQVGVSSNGAPINLRAQTAALSLTAYYRPEDLEFDPVALAAGKVRVCGNNTGQDAQGATADNHWGETFCITDGSSLADAALPTSIPEYQLLNMGTSEMSMVDNIAFQPGRHNILLNEDADDPGWAVNPRNNDIWDCLDDGADADSLADACVRVMSINDLNAETTGGIFDGTGKAYYVSVQHNVTGHGVILKVTGWQ